MMNDLARDLSVVVFLILILMAVDFIRYALLETRKERDRAYLIEIFRDRGEIDPEGYLEMLEEREIELRSQRLRKHLPQRRQDDAT